MAATFRSAVNDGFSNLGTLTLTKPTGTTDGDGLIAIFYSEAGSGVTLTPPAGWSSVTAADNGVARLEVFKKIASGEGASWSFTQSGAVYWRKGSLAYSNPSTGFIEASSAGATGQTGGTQTAPSVTTLTINAVVLAIVGLRTTSSGATSTPPSGMTERTDDGTGLTYFESSADVSQASPGASGTKDFTVTSTPMQNALAITLSITGDPLPQPAEDDSPAAALVAPPPPPYLVEEEAIPVDGVYLPGDPPDFDAEDESSAALLPPLPDRSGFAAQVAVEDSEVSQIPAEWLPGQPPDYDAEQESDASNLPPLSTLPSEAAAQNAVDDAEVIPVSGAYPPGDPPDNDAEQESDASLLPPLPPQPSEQAAQGALDDAEVLPVSGAGVVLDAPWPGDDESADWDTVLASTGATGAFSASLAGAAQQAIDDAEVIPVSGLRAPHSHRMGAGSVSTDATGGGTVRGGS